MDLDLSGPSLTLQPEGTCIEMPCHRFASHAKACCFKIAVKEHTVIPPSCEMIVPGQAVDSKVSTGLWVNEPIQRFVGRKGLLVAKSLADMETSGNSIPLRIVNLQDEPCETYPDTMAATCEQIDPDDIVTLETVNCATTDNTKQKQKYRGMFETQKSRIKTSSGDIGLNIRTLASPKVGQDQVSGGVSVLCWYAAPVANVLWKPFAIR